MAKIGRNDPCPCGSGRKFKKCCYLDAKKAEDAQRAAERTRRREVLASLPCSGPWLYELEVSLDSRGPERFGNSISRTIRIESTDTLYDLHLAIQEAFDWDNDHMFSFYMSNELWDHDTEYTANPLGEFMPRSSSPSGKPAGEGEIGDLLLRVGDCFKYLFDYGDKIVHTITVTNVSALPVPDPSLPKVVRSIGEAPPQDNW